jgi:hypothetical protein
MGRESYDGRRAMKVQLSRLFGATSKRATSESNAQLKKTLDDVLVELDKYLLANVDTDDFHLMTLRSGLRSASESLKQDDFWPGYAEGVTRLALILLGDYPDHRRRKKGKKTENHYKLNMHRTLQYAQSPQQRLSTLNGAANSGLIEFSKFPMDVLHNFRDEYGYGPSLMDFLEWYRKSYPADYVKLFR